MKVSEFLKIVRSLTGSKFYAARSDLRVLPKVQLSGVFVKDPTQELGVAPVALLLDWYAKSVLTEEKWEVLVELVDGRQFVVDPDYELLVTPLPAFGPDFMGGSNA